MSETRELAPWPKLARISKKKLIVDSRYQRDTSSRKSQALIKHIKDSFNPMQFGVISVTDNGDDTYCILDGQHRWNGVMLIPEIDDVPCLIGDAETIKEQAQAFVSMNTKRITVTPLALYHARLRAGEKDSILIDRVISKAGCSVPRAAGPTDQLKAGEVICLNAVKKNIRLCGEDTTVNALALMKRVWIDDGGIRGEIVSAICTVLHLKRLSLSALEEVMKSRTPEQILAYAYIRRAQAESENEKKETLTKHIVKLLVQHGSPVIKLRQTAT